MTAENGWNLPAPERPKPWSRKAKAALACGVITTAGAGLILTAVIPALVVGGEIRSMVEREDQHRAETIETLESKHPWITDLRSDPVWDSPEWKAIASVQSADHFASYRAATAEIRQDVDRMVYGPRQILQRALDDLAPEPFSAGPLNDSTVVSPAFLSVVIHAYRACETGEPDAYIAGTDLTDPPFHGENAEAMVQTWDAGAELLVGTAVSYACGAETP